MEQIINSSDQTFLTLWSFKCFITLFMTVDLNCQMMERGDAWQFGVFATQLLTMLERLVNVSRCNELMMFRINDVPFNAFSTFENVFRMFWNDFETILNIS